MKLYAGATNEQYIDNLLKQTYSTLQPILVDERFQSAINRCINNSIQNNEKDLENLVKVCQNYSFITFFKDLYLLPKNVDYLSIYLIAILILLIIIIFILVIITFNLLFAHNN